MTNLLLLTLCYAALMLAHPYLHAWLNEVRKVWITHWLHALYAAIAAAFIAYLFLGYSHYVIYAVALYLAFRWTVHDIALNLFRNLFRPTYGLPYLAFNYTGEIDGEDAKLDQLPHFQKWQYLYKMGVIGLTIGTILLIEHFH